LSKPLSLVKRVLYVKNFGHTLMRFGIIKCRDQIDNFNLDTKRYFGLFECKEYVERCIENGWIK
jgi:hypothetical protein